MCELWFALRDGCGDEAHEEGLRGEGAAREFGVVLGADEVGVHRLWELEHLHDLELWVASAEDESLGVEFGDRGGFDFVAVAEAFADFCFVAVEETCE